MLDRVQWKMEMSPVSNMTDPARSAVNHVISLILTAGGLSTFQADITNPPVSAIEPSEQTHLFFFIWDDAGKERNWKDGSTTDVIYESRDKYLAKL